MFLGGSCRDVVLAAEIPVVLNIHQTLLANLGARPS